MDHNGHHHIWLHTPVCSNIVVSIGRNILASICRIYFGEHWQQYFGEHLQQIFLRKAEIGLKMAELKYQKLVEKGASK